MIPSGIDYMLVPCPGWGWYQQNMLHMARRLYGRWMLNTGACLIFFLFFGVPCAIASAQQHAPEIPSAVFVGCLIALAVVAIALIFAKFILARFYDLNSEDVEVRKQVGRSRAILREELERRIKAQQEQRSEQEDQD